MHNSRHAPPLVTAIIPTFNRRSFLVKAIESALAQTYENMEVIVVDDGSVDGTDDSVAALGSRVRSLRYFKKRNGGCASARNSGLDQASGELLSFLDSDDTWLPSAIEGLVRTLRETGADLVYSPAIEIYPDGREVINYPVAAGRPRALAREHFLATNVRTGSYLFTREAMQRAGRLDETLLHNEDSDYLQRLAMHSRAAYSPLPTVRVYNHAGAKSRRRVEIYQALLRSSKRTLAQHPQFARDLGPAAAGRLDQIRAQLIDALILAGEYRSAQQVANDVSGRLRLPAAAAILIRRSFPLRVELALRELSHAAARAISRLGAGRFQERSAADHQLVDGF